MPNIGVNKKASDLPRRFSRHRARRAARNISRDLKVPGRELNGIHFAMDFLPQSNKVCEGDSVPDQILATGKRVVIIGEVAIQALDCSRTSHRQGAAHITQFELMPKTAGRTLARKLRGRCGRCSYCVESSHEEGGLRDWSINTVEDFQAMQMAT